jgi:hypothetical protein
LTSFFIQKKVESKQEKLAKPAQKAKIYTDFECKAPKFAYKQELNIEEFDKELSHQNRAITQLQLTGSKVPLRKTRKAKKKFIFVGDSNINRGGKKASKMLPRALFVPKFDCDSEAPTS